jgi:hypothetical protein
LEFYKDQAIVAIHSQNKTAENHLKYYLVFTLGILAFMNHYTAGNIYMLNASYLKQYFQTEAHYTCIILFVQYTDLVQKYFHYFDTEELPSEASTNKCSEDH